MENTAILDKIINEEEEKFAFDSKGFYKPEKYHVPRSIVIECMVRYGDHVTQIKNSEIKTTESKEKSAIGILFEEQGKLNPKGSTITYPPGLYGEKICLNAMEKYADIKLQEYLDNQAKANNENESCTIEQSLAEVLNKYKYESDPTPTFIHVEFLLKCFKIYQKAAKKFFKGSLKFKPLKYEMKFSELLLNSLHSNR